MTEIPLLPTPVSGWPVGSTFGYPVAPTIGIDPGTEWCGVCLRVGDFAFDAMTLHTPVGPAGDLHSCLAAYERVRAAVNVMWDRWADPATAAVWASFGVDQPDQFDVAIESARPARNRNFPVDDWWGLLGVVRLLHLEAFPGSVLVAPNHHEKRHQRCCKRHPGGSKGLFYPDELHGPRPPGFMASEHPSNVRKHEVAAFVVAGEAALIRQKELIPA